MGNIQDSITRRDGYREKVLVAAYEIWDANPRDPFDRDALAKRTGLGQEALDEAIDYALGEGWLDAYKTTVLTRYTLTHEGKKHAESLLVA